MKRGGAKWSSKGRPNYTILSFEEKHQRLDFFKAKILVGTIKKKIRICLGEGRAGGICRLCGMTSQALACNNSLLLSVDRQPVVGGRNFLLSFASGSE